jgi:hypothetical protein
MTKKNKQGLKIRKGNQKPLIEEHTIPWPIDKKVKRTNNDLQIIT